MLFAVGRKLSFLGCLIINNIFFTQHFLESHLKTLVRTRHHIAPFLDHGDLDNPGVDLRPHADLLRHVEAILDLLKAGHQLGHVLAGCLGVEAAGLLWIVTDYCLNTVLKSIKIVDKPNTESFYV